MGSSPNLGFGWVWVSACGFKSQCGFRLGSSPETWVQVPICVLARFRPLVLLVSELPGLTLTAKHQEKVLYSIWLAGKKTKIQNSKSSSYWTCMTLIPLQSQKIVSWGPFALLWRNKTFCSCMWHVCIFILGCKQFICYSRALLKLQSTDKCRIEI